MHGSSDSRVDYCPFQGASCLCVSTFSSVLRFMFLGCELRQKINKELNFLFSPNVPKYFILAIPGKKLIEKFRECHNHKPQPTPDTKRKRKRQNDPCKINKQTHEKHTDEPHHPPQARRPQRQTVLEKTNTRTKSNARLNMKRPAAKPTKPHKIRNT